MDLTEANIDPGRLLEFHDVMLSRAQDDERARKVWEESDAADARRRREALRQKWRAFYLHMSDLHSGLAEEHRLKARALEGEGALLE